MLKYRTRVAIFRNEGQVFREFLLVVKVCDGEVFRLKEVQKREGGCIPPCITLVP